MSSGKYLFTSESVSMGHPDKLADQISDAILDAMLAQDPHSRVACETLVTTGMALLAGEITSNAVVDFQTTVRNVIRDVGYTNADYGIDGKTCAVMVALDKQSPDIAQGVDESENKQIGAGDQGLMFGFACDETEDYMPLTIQLSHKILMKLAEARFEKKVDWLRPDSKSQVTIEYDGFTPVRIDTVVVSTQHDPDVTQAEIKEFVTEEIVKPLLPSELIKGEIKYHINPTGKFVIGGPHGDCGLTGRKIIVDTYGGAAPHGGGAFSGKDPTKVDRSAAYAARYLAKNVVAAGLAERCTIQLAYAIGVSRPLALYTDLHGTGEICEDRLSEVLQELVNLSPRGIREHLGLNRPIYRRTAAYGHFGREPEADGGFSWERLDLVDELKRAFNAS